MKKVLSVMMLALLVSFVYGQQVNQSPAPQKLNDTRVQHLNKKQAAASELRTFGDVIWEETFGGGVIPADWDLVDNTGLGWNWKWDDDTIPGSGGQYSTNSPKFLSTTGENGYMLLPGDEYNTINGGAFVDQDASITTPAINCDTADFVMLTFQQSFRHCCASEPTHQVSVSVDGTNWTDFDVRNDVEPNDASENPDVVYINITSIAAHQSTVYIKFYHTGTSHYYWAVDDIALITPPNNDLQIKDHYVLSVYENYNQGYYSRLPLSQVTDFFFETEVYNNGSDDQTNAILNVEILENDVVIATSDDTMAVHAPDSTFTYGDTYLPTAAGNFSAAWELTQDGGDELPEDNTADTISWSVVSNNIMARDVQFDQGLSPSLYTGGADGDLLGLNYFITSETTTPSISVFIDYRTDAYTTIIGQIYKIDNGAWVKQIESQEFIVQPHHVGHWVDLPLITVNPGDDVLLAGSQYLTAIEFYWGGSEDVKCWIGADADGPHDFQNSTSLRIGQEWYYITNLPMIRLNLADATHQPEWTNNTPTTICHEPGVTNQTIELTATDPNGLSLEFSSINLPEFVDSFTDNGDGTVSMVLTTSNADVSEDDRDTYLFEYTVSNGVEENPVFVNAMVEQKDDCELAIIEDKLSDVSVYPNPSNSTLFVENAVNSQIKIYSLVGELVYTGVANSTTSKINVSNLAPGAYVISIENNADVYKQQITIVR